MIITPIRKNLIMASRYYFDSTLGRYVQSGSTYTGASTKMNNRFLEPHELENIKIRQIERIANVLERIAESLQQERESEA